ncbi:thaumatin-like protein 1b [Nymphaea colorata]|nr:thaumatin-like protein 1b [Nymphaea colorata]
MAPLFPISTSSQPFLFFFLFFSGVHSATFTMTNNCAYTVWPGVLANAGTAPLSTTGFELKQGETVALAAPSGWSGRFWSRTLCSTDSTGKFSCVTGDCGSGRLECSGAGAKPPATLAEFTLGNGALDFYDVSLVDGFNAPMMVTPQRGTGNCAATGCLADLNGACPSALRVTEATSGEGVACKSACEAFGDPRYCCSGSYGTADTCGPTPYSRFFKNACPRAYSYAYDDPTSTFTCSGADYLITFCPSVPSQKSSSNQFPSINNTMIFSGMSDPATVSSDGFRQGTIDLLWLVAATIFLMLTWTC